MLDELMALKDKEISQQKFDETFALHQNKFNLGFNTKVKDMLSNKTLSDIGNG